MLKQSASQLMCSEMWNLFLVPGLPGGGSVAAGGGGAEAATAQVAARSCQHMAAGLRAAGSPLWQGAAAAARRRGI